MTDVPALARARVRSWNAAYQDILPATLLARMHPSTSAARLRRAIVKPRPGERIHVAREGGRALGYVWSGRHGGRWGFEGELYELYIDPDAQRRGLGGSLLRVALWSLIERGLDPAMVWVLSRNPARAFYEAHGGVEFAESAIVLEEQRFSRIGFGWRDALPLPPT